MEDKEASQGKTELDEEKKEAEEEKKKEKR